MSVIQLDVQVRVGKMTKDFTQACGVLLMTLQCGCSADNAADSTNTAVLSEQTALVRSVLRNSTAPTPEQLTALQAPEARNAFIHDEVPFEQWHLFGFADENDRLRLAYSTRVSRFSVRSRSQDTSASSWDFNDIMVLESDIVDIEQAKSQTRQQVERVALELAGTDTNAQKIWVGATAIEKLSGSADASRAVPKERLCETQYRLNLPLTDAVTLKMDAAQMNCADSSILRSAVQRSASSMQATLANTVSDLKSDGRAWLVQAWGWPLDSGDAAVVFDRAWLVLGDEYEIQLQQTKRRSGKGPKTTSGTRWTLESKEATPVSEDVSLDWTTDRSGSTIQWHISSASHGIDIVVEQIFQTALSSGSRWFGPVKISGTHEGLGFMDYQPL